MAPTFEEMMDSLTKPKPRSSADSNDTEGPNATESRPSSPVASDHSMGLNDTEFQALAHSLDETTIPVMRQAGPNLQAQPIGILVRRERENIHKDTLCDAP